MTFSFIVILFLAFLFIILLAKTAIVVPQQSAYVVERLGRYSATIGAGFHILLPFVDAIRYRHTLKEQVIELQGQAYTTRDDRQIEIAGLLRLKVLDPRKASYAVHDFRTALVQLTGVVLRQETGKHEADRAREDWAAPIAAAVTSEIASKAEPWGIEVLCFELENMTENLRPEGRQRRAQ
jgi:regulator of protease activity HflC (stomatin/prohibitin superfamily)